MSSSQSAGSRRKFEQAVALMQQGHLAAAEVLCAELLARSPHDAELAHFGGILANRMGRFDLAIERLSRCLALDPKRARSHAALAFAQENLGRLEEARESFAAAVRADPRFAEAHNGLGVALSRLGRTEEALQSFERAIAARPHFVEAELNAARALLQLGRNDPAAQRFRNALQLAADNDDVLRQVALGLHGARAFESAVAAMRRYLARHADEAMRGDLAQALDALGRGEEAQVELERALAASPATASLHNVRGAFAQKRGDMETAAAAFRRAIELDPESFEARVNLVLALRLLGKLEESDRERELARTCATSNAVALTRLASLYAGEGEAKQAIELFGAAIALNPQLPGPHGLLGIELLRTGRYEQGWPEYLYRPARGTEIYEAIARGQYPPRFTADVRARQVAILGEQGLGDVIFFLRYAKPLADAGARLSVHADARLEPLLRRALPIENWFAAGTMPRHGSLVWAGDLPVAAHALAGDIAPTLRIAPLAERVERMRQRLPAGDGPLVGVAWHAGTPPSSAPAGQSLLLKKVTPEVLAQAIPQGARCIVIQRNPDPAALQRLRALVEAHDFSDVNEDLEDMLALLSLLDDYVGVSSTNVHLLAAVGGRGHILVPHPVEWRWQLSGPSPWFPGFGVHRQARGGDWSAALKSLQGGEL